MTTAKFWLAFRSNLRVSSGQLLEEGPDNITQQKEDKENALPVCGKGAKQGENNQMHSYGHVETDVRSRPCFIPS